MKEKKGISLIVLIVTIIVMIIIAGAIIISLTETNVIDQAEVAVEKHNMSEIKSAVSLAYADWVLEGQTRNVQNYIRESLVDQNIIKPEEMNKYYINKTGGIEFLEEANDSTLIFTAEIPSDEYTYAITEVSDWEGSGDYTIDWGDGTIEHFNTYMDNIQQYHTYAKKGQYDIKIIGEDIGQMMIDGEDVVEIKSIGNMKQLNYFLISAGSKLKSIPDLKLDNLTDIDIMITGLEEISKNLLIGTPKLEGISFLGCTNLKTVPVEVFDPVSDTLKDISRLFEDCTSLEGDVPEFWDTQKYPNITSHTDWLKGVDPAKITNYADIPEDWR